MCVCVCVCKEEERSDCLNIWTGPLSTVKSVSANRKRLSALLADINALKDAFIDNSILLKIQSTLDLNSHVVITWSWSWPNIWLLGDKQRLTFLLNYVLCSEIKEFLGILLMLFSDPQNLGPFFGTQEFLILIPLIFFYPYLPSPHRLKTFKEYPWGMERNNPASHI